MVIANLAGLFTPFLDELRSVGVEAWQWTALALAAVASLLVAWALAAGGLAAARVAARRRHHPLDEKLLRRAAGPLRLLLATAAFGVLHRGVHLAPPAQEVVHHLLRILVVTSVVWMAIRGTRDIADAVEAHVDREGAGAEGRARVTRVKVLRRVVDVVVVVVGAGTVLLQFGALRALGTSMLASASVAGIVVGLAAQRSLVSLFAGIQISITQPIRVGDVVLVDGVNGTIEEITLTYVVVRIWDRRCLIVPITRFFDTPFQNWTRNGTAILGSAALHADYRVPVAELRGELRRFVASRREWDGKSVSLDVTGATERTLELTAVVSASDSDRNGALLSAVREHLVDWLQRVEGGRSLPRQRMEPVAVARAEPLGPIGSDHPAVDR